MSSRTCRSGSARSCRRPARRPSRRAARPTAARRARSSGSSCGGECRTGRGRARPARAGGPVRARAFAAATSAGDGPGSSAQTASTGAAYGVPASSRASRSSSMPGRCSCSSARPPAQVGGGGELEDGGQEVGQLGAGELDAGRPVARLERGERGPAAAGLAVGPPGQVQAAAASGVEHLDVVLRRPARAWWPRRCRGTRSSRSRAGSAGSCVDRAADQRHSSSSAASG